MTAIWYFSCKSGFTKVFLPLDNPYLPLFFGQDDAQGKRSLIDIVIKTFLNPKGHQNHIIGSKVTAILLKG